MQSKQFSRRALTISLAAVPLGMSAANWVLGAANGTKKQPNAIDGLTDSSEAIRQEVAFEAIPQRVYDALTNTKQFDAITRLSDGAALLAAPGAKPTDISTQLGGSFTLFGGYVTGRHLEMLPNERLVQAWRAGSWKAGAYSIVAFSLTAEGARTKLKFDHCGFPNGNGESLAKGWHAHYWEPLARFLAQS